MKAVLGKMLVAAGDPFGATGSLAKSWTSNVVKIAAAIFILVVVVTGLFYAFSGREMKQKIKSKWVDVIIAAVAVFGGSMIVGWLVNFIQQNGFKG